MDIASFAALFALSLFLYVLLSWFNIITKKNNGKVINVCNIGSTKCWGYCGKMCSGNCSSVEDSFLNLINKDMTNKEFLEKNGYSIDPMPEPSIRICLQMALKQFKADENASNNGNQDKEEESKTQYDVCIAGAGIAGLTQAYHLLLKHENMVKYCTTYIKTNTNYDPTVISTVLDSIKFLRPLKIVIIDPLSEDRLETEYRALKIGESTVFPSANFLANELGLNDYLIEHHPPKHGLFYHWPKHVDKTDTIQDYFSTAALSIPDNPSYQLNRAKIERDLLKLVKDKGVTFFNGNVKKVNLIEGNNKKNHEIIVNLNNNDCINLSAEHLVDAAGRRFIIGTAKQLMIKDPKQLYGISNASVWVRAKNCNYAYLMNSSAKGETTTSWHYATNHFMGHGYWLWVIPIETREGQDISIGVSFHKQCYQLSQFNTKQRFMEFLKQNQTLLYKTIVSGEIIDFHVLPKLAHLATRILSPDRWYLLGDACYNADPFYSTGMVMISFEVQMVTASILAYRSGHPEYDKLVEAYNTGITSQGKRFIHIIADHWKHLGNASIMSWRIFFESINSLSHAPNFLSKWVLCPHHAGKVKLFVDNSIWFYQGIYDILSDIADKRLNIGFADYNEPDTIHLLKNKTLHSIVNSPDQAMIRGKFAYKRTNLYKYTIEANKLLINSLIIIVYRAYGIKGFFQKRVHERIFYCLKTMLKNYPLAWEYDKFLKNTFIPSNLRFVKRKYEFDSYVPPVSPQIHLNDPSQFVEWRTDTELDMEDSKADLTVYND